MDNRQPAKDLKDSAPEDQALALEQPLDISDRENIFIHAFPDSTIGFFTSRKGEFKRYQTRPLKLLETVNLDHAFVTRRNCIPVVVKGKLYFIHEYSVLRDEIRLRLLDDQGKELAAVSAIVLDYNDRFIFLFDYTRRCDFNIIWEPTALKPTFYFLYGPSNLPRLGCIRFFSKTK